MRILLAFLVTTSIQAQINQFDTSGKRHGVWKKNFEGTSVLRYQGEFSHGKEIGTFKFYKNINNKAILTATRTFNPNSTIAKVTFYTSNGKVLSQGEMDGKTYIGKWVYYHGATQQIMSIEHYNSSGKLHGEKIIFYKNGNTAEVTNYVNGNLDGVSKMYSEKGIQTKILHYKNNMLHGLFKAFNSSQQVTVEGYYKNDRKDGIWKYYQNGKLIRSKDYTRKSKNPYKKKQ